MAAKAFAATAAYDSMISQWFAFADQQQLFPEMLAVNGYRAAELRYGEIPKLESEMAEQEQRLKELHATSGSMLHEEVTDEEVAEIRWYADHYVTYRLDYLAEPGGAIPAIRQGRV